MPHKTTRPHPHSTSNPLPAVKSRYLYWMALTGYFGLFLLLMLWPTLLAPPSHLPVALLLIVTVTPLLLPLRGLLNKNLKSCAWSAYISLIYFTHGIIEAFANSMQRGYAILEIIFSLLLFLGASLYIRGTGKG